jgi:hypothetical protein
MRATETIDFIEFSKPQFGGGFLYSPDPRAPYTPVQRRNRPPLRTARSSIGRISGQLSQIRHRRVSAREALLGPRRQRSVHLHKIVSGDPCRTPYEGGDGGTLTALNSALKISARKFLTTTPTFAPSTSGTAGMCSTSPLPFHPGQTGPPQPKNETTLALGSATGAAFERPMI